MAVRLSARMVTIVLAAVSTSTSIGADTYPRQSGIDAEHYVFRIGIDDTKPDITGEATVRFRFTAAGVTSVALDLATPANEKGPVDVSVMFDSGDAFKIPNGFRYVEPGNGEAARRAFFDAQKGAGKSDKIEVEKKQP